MAALHSESLCPLRARIDNLYQTPQDTQVTGNGRGQPSKRFSEKISVALAACVRFLELPARGVNIRIELRINFVSSVLLSETSGNCI